MTKTKTAATPPKMPKSYLLDEKERAAFLREGSPEGIYAIGSGTPVNMAPRRAGASN